LTRELNFEEYSSLESFDEDQREVVMSLIPSDLPIVDPPRKKDLESLLELNFRLERNSITNNYVEAKFLGKNLKSKHLNALLKITDQLIKLDLSNTKLE
tara:strand:- start:493 stop:789 length:297 start_codon:yes stop_codon:yes gene_type:complete